jgi:uncharacterized cupin superfamily protein
MNAAANPLSVSDEAFAAHGPFVAMHVDEADFRDAPIPQDWILAGQPRARAALHSRSVDETATTTVWDCTSGRFRWHYGWEEAVLILEGQVKVTAEDGAVRILTVGDAAFFAAGTSALWEIDAYVRKLAFCRRELPPSIRLALKWRDQARSAARSLLGPARALLSARRRGN